MRLSLLVRPPRFVLKEKGDGKIISHTIIIFMFRHAGLRRSFICCFFLLSSFARRGRERKREEAEVLALSLARWLPWKPWRAFRPRAPTWWEKSLTRCHAARTTSPPPPPSFTHFFLHVRHVHKPREKNIHNCNNRFCDAFKDPRCCSPFPDEVFSFYFLSAAESYG